MDHVPHLRRETGKRFPCLGDSAPHDSVPRTRPAQVAMMLRQTRSASTSTPASPSAPISPRKRLDSDCAPGTESARSRLMRASPGTMRRTTCPRRPCCVPGHDWRQFVPSNLQRFGVGETASRRDQQRNQQDGARFAAQIDHRVTACPRQNAVARLPARSTRRRSANSKPVPA
jgi:hypothetical protein